MQINHGYLFEIFFCYFIGKLHLSFVGLSVCFVIFRNKAFNRKNPFVSIFLRFRGLNIV